MQRAGRVLPHGGGGSSSSAGTGVGVVTAGLLLETSVGSLTIDLFGADCPALSANFLNLCRAQLWNGAVATEVVPEVAVFFSLTADPVYRELLQNLLHSHSTHAAAAPSSDPGTLNFWTLLPRQVCVEGDASAMESTAIASLQSHAKDLASSAVDLVRQQEGLVQQAMQQEARICKRRRCVGLATSRVGDKSRKGVYQPVYVSVPGNTGAAVVADASGGQALSSSCSPCTVCRAGRLLVDVSAPTLRFGLTLSDRTMDFLDRQYITIGVVREGEAVLRRIRRAPLRDASGDSRQSAAGAAPGAAIDVVAGRPALSWSRPVRMLRVKRAVVLPTAGTEQYVAIPPSAWWGVSSTMGCTATMEQQQQERRHAATALHQAGCFKWWAPAAAVRAARRQLVELVQASVGAHGFSAITRPRTVADASNYMHSEATQPLILISAAPSPERARIGDDDDAGKCLGEPELVCNAHYTGDYLSSEDDDALERPSGAERLCQNAAMVLSAKQLEERRKTFMQQHQEKANETLSLMLNVLNGVADVRGDIKPPENVLFVCKLNPVTTGEGLALCFAQFGRVTSAEVIYDAKTKQSLCYGFVEFESVEACFRAFQKMDRALIDDCRIHVDFSQSVSKLWAQQQRELRKRGHACLE